MIPLYKLEKLPRTQKLRKIAKVFSYAENRLYSFCKSNSSAEKPEFTSAELEFLSDAAKLLAADELFSAEERSLFINAVTVFSKSDKYEADDLLRMINNIKHLLYKETGKDQAEWDFTVNGGRLDAEKRQIFKGMQTYFEDIRSPFNVGAMFRTAESFGVEKIILSPFCADPLHRRAQRTAMGCVDTVPWERQALFLPEQANDRKTDIPVFALETGGIPLEKFQFPKQGLLIVGSEELGVSPSALAAADASLGRVSIPIYGAKASLNVSVAFGIALNKWSKIYMENIY